MGRKTKILTPKEISQKYASGHLACTREINNLIRHVCKEQREICWEGAKDANLRMDAIPLTEVEKRAILHAPEPPK